VQFLTENSNLISDLTGSKDSIVHWAATCGLSEHLSRFLDEFPELLEAINIVGETPLICAARHGNAICVGELVLRGAEVDHVSFTGETALHWLVSFPDEVVEVIGALLVTPKSLVCYALARKQTPTIAVTGLTVVPGTPLQRAVALRRNTVVEFLLNGGADCFSPGLVGYDEDTLQEAGVSRNYEVPDAHGMAFLPIHRACQAHDDKMIPTSSRPWGNKTSRGGLSDRSTTRYTGRSERRSRRRVRCHQLPLLFPPWIRMRAHQSILPNVHSWSKASGRSRPNV
jgi:hypothetical protein